MPNELHLRDPILIRGILLSVQASMFHYCTPQLNDLGLDKYRTVEVALFKAVDGKTPIAVIEEEEEEFLLPSEVHESLKEFDTFFESKEDGLTPIAAYMASDDMRRLKSRLEKLCGCERAKILG